VNEESVRDYYRSDGLDPNSLKYRLDAQEDIRGFVDELRGGCLRVGGKKQYNERYRKLNETGISAVQTFLMAQASKIVHLTRYKNENRIHMQVKYAARALLKELTKNIKEWGPLIPVEVTTETTPDELRELFGSDYLFVASVDRVGDRYVAMVKTKAQDVELIIVGAEEIMLASKQRGHQGKEQELTAPNVLIHENQGPRQEQNPGLLGRFFQRPSRGEYQ
jgi:hypothetical protein